MFYLFFSVFFLFLFFFFSLFSLFSFYFFSKTSAVKNPLPGSKRDLQSLTLFSLFSIFMRFFEILGSDLGKSPAFFVFWGVIFFHRKNRLIVANFGCRGRLKKGPVDARFLQKNRIIAPYMHAPVARHPSPTMAVRQILDFGLQFKKTCFGSRKGIKRRNYGTIR